MIRKNNSKSRCIALCVVIAFLLVACAPVQPAPNPEAGATPYPAAETPGAMPGATPAGFTAGAYTAEVNAYNGPMVVEVAVSAQAITDVKVTSHSETYGIGANAIEQLPGRIVSAQSIAVDTITGCTVSSGALLYAAKEALIQAGGDITAFTKPTEKYMPPDVVMHADVVVAGAGLAGLCAAVSAAEEGASVLLLEKAGFTGGASAASGGEILAAGTSVQEAAGIKDTAQALVDYWLEKGEGKVDKEMVTYVGLTSPKTIDWLIKKGAKLEMQTPTSMPWQDPMRCHKTQEGIASLTGTGGGVGFTIPLTKAAEALGVQILYETPAQSLIMNGAEVTGILATNKQGAKITINAKQVILATGGFDGNDEMMKAYAPLLLGRSNVGALHAGDGHVMAKNAGAEMLYRPSGVVALAFDYGATGLTMSDIYGQYLYVLPNGQRFMDESQYWFVRSGNLIKNNASFYWTIVGADSGIANLDIAVEGGTAQKGNSVEELAQKIGVEPATLKATVERYNEMCEKGKDGDFGKKDTNMKKMGVAGTNLNAIGEGPYYAIHCALISVSGSLGGPKINLDGQVLNTNGDVIKGLYAAGELANAQFYHVYYPCSGSSLQYCATMGRRAGEHAALASK